MKVHPSKTTRKSASNLTVLADKILTKNTSILIKLHLHFQLLCKIGIDQFYFRKLLQTIFRFRTKDLVRIHTTDTPPPFCDAIVNTFVSSFRVMNSSSHIFPPSLFFNNSKDLEIFEDVIRGGRSTN